MFSFILERGERGKRERDNDVKETDWLPPSRILTRERTHIYLVYSMTLLPTEQPGQDCRLCSLKMFHNGLLSVPISQNFVHLPLELSLSFTNIFQFSNTLT